MSKYQTTLYDLSNLISDATIDDFLKKYYIHIHNKFSDILLKKIKWCSDSISHCLIYDKISNESDYISKVVLNNFIEDGIEILDCLDKNTERIRWKQEIKEIHKTHNSLYRIASHDERFSNIFNNTASFWNEIEEKIPRDILDIFKKSNIDKNTEELVDYCYKLVKILIFILVMENMKEVLSISSEIDKIITNH